MSNKKEELLSLIQTHLKLYSNLLNSMEQIKWERKSLNKDTRIFPNSYSMAYEIDWIITRLNKIDVDTSEQKKKFLGLINRFHTIINKDRSFITQFVTYHFFREWTSFISDIILHDWLIDIGKTSYDSYANGGVLDYTLNSRDYIEYIILGIKFIGHEDEYPWLNSFINEISLNDAKVDKVVQDSTIYYTKINAISLNPDYLEMYPPSFWWRKLEYNTFCKTKKSSA